MAAKPFEVSKAVQAARDARKNAGIAMADEVFKVSDKIKSHEKALQDAIKKAYHKRVAACTTPEGVANAQATYDAAVQAAYKIYDAACEAAKKSLEPFDAAYEAAKKNCDAVEAAELSAFRRSISARRN